MSADTLGCGSTSGMKCTRVMRGSGTMYAAAYVNGLQQQKSIRLTVKVPELHLSASKSIVAAPGENDTFTATANGSLTVLGWSFTPDGGGAADQLATSSAALGARTAKTRSAAGAASALSATFGGLTVPMTSRRFATPGSAWDACTSGAAECTNLVTESGTVDVLAIVNGDTLRATVPVQVVPCPTGDAVLDDPRTREVFKMLRDSSHANDPVVSDRVERIAVLIDSSGSAVWKILPLNADPTKHTPCEVNASLPQSWKILAIAHTHPFEDGEREADPRCPNGGYAYYLKTVNTGWASGVDWLNSSSKKAPSYIIDSARVVRIRGDSANVHARLDRQGYPIPDKNGNLIWEPDRDWKKWTREFPRYPNRNCSPLAPFAVLFEPRMGLVAREESVARSWFGPLGFDEA